MIGARPSSAGSRLTPAHAPGGHTAVRPLGLLGLWPKFSGGETLLQLEISYSWAPVKPRRGQTLRSPRPKVTSVLTRLTLRWRREEHGWRGRVGKSIAA